MTMSALSRRGSSLAAALALFFLTAGSPAQASYLYVTPNGSTTGGGSVSAQASITVNNGSFTVVLTDLLANPTADSQEISGIKFTVSGALGSGSLATVNSGNISTISSGGSYTSGVADPLTRWTATGTTGSSPSIDLNTYSGGSPNRLIIGPDSKGSFNPAGGGLYSNANNSITGNHQPSILGSATFTVTDSGITTSSIVTAVTFEFGTSQGSNQVAGQLVPSVPEPASIISAGMGLLGVVGVALRRRRRQHSA
jgi:MYXO-CTERM domain-containing protein